MNRFMRTLIITSLAVCATTSFAKRERKNPPPETIVNKALKAAGPEHYPENLDLERRSETCKLKETYIFIIEGYVKKDDYPYRFYFFDNKQNYIGYYATDLELGDIEDGAIVFYQGGDADDGGAIDEVMITAEGPPLKTEINGMQIRLVKAPEKKKEEEGVESGPEGPTFEYRTWTIKFKGKELPARAQYVKTIGNKVVLKLEKNGMEKAFDKSSLSLNDLKYLKTIEEIIEEED